MIFYHASSIHTVGMRFAIDIIFVKKSGEILRIEPIVQPGRFLLCPSYATIELPENRSFEKKLEKGTILKWFQNEESGQVLVEYALILALLVLGMLVAFIPLMERVQEFLHSIIAYLIDI
jgi:Flp pilus assembly pilin Flp